MDAAAAVSDFQVILKRNLPYSTVARIKVWYENPDSHLPADFFLKLTPGSATDSYSIDIGKKEVEFYKRLAPEMGCPALVRCFDATYSEASGRSSILMEGLSETHSQPEQNTAPCETLSRLAVKALAEAHAVWWNSPQLGKTVGQLFDEKMLAEFVKNLEMSVADFIKHSGVDLSTGQRKAYDLMLANANHIWGRLMNAKGLTVTHGDCHWWNFLYPKDADIDSVRIFDWHLWHIDLGARDLAFLLALGGFAEPRPKLEKALLHVYHETLVANGVLDYSRETLWEDYRWSAIRNLNIPVIFWSQGKHKSTWQTSLRRAFESFERLRCSDLFA